MKPLYWPEFKFPPINLWVLGPWRGRRETDMKCPISNKNCEHVSEPLLTWPAYLYESPARLKREIYHVTRFADDWARVAFVAEAPGRLGIYQAFVPHTGSSREGQTIYCALKRTGDHYLRKSAWTTNITDLTGTL